MTSCRLKHLLLPPAAATLAALTPAAFADITVGVTVSATGPAASLGIPEKNTIALMPGSIGGQKVNHIVLDDTSDTTAAVSNVRKLITENKVDVVLGSATTPNSRAIATHMADAGIKTVGFIDFADAYGEGWLKKSAMAYVTKYEAANGAGSVSAFGAHAWDAGLLMQVAATAALKKAQPGTPEFHAALRDALETVNELPGAHGVFNMSPTDHLGLDQRARVMVKIENGAWKYLP